MRRRRIQEAKDQALGWRAPWEMPEDLKAQAREEIERKLSSLSVSVGGHRLFVRRIRGQARIGPLIACASRSKVFKVKSVEMPQSGGDLIECW